MLRFTPFRSAGFLPMFFDDEDMRPAKDQLHENYAHGGGYKPFEGFELQGEQDVVGDLRIKYAGDPPLPEVSRAQLRDELLVLFQYQWLAIIQPDGSFVISRVD